MGGVETQQHVWTQKAGMASPLLYKWPLGTRPVSQWYTVPNQDFLIALKGPLKPTTEDKRWQLLHM